MNLDVAFGQYYEGDSVIHRLDPRFKIIVTVLYIVAIFLAKNVFAFGLLFVSLLMLIFMTKIPVRIILKGMKSLVFIILITAVLNIFWWKGETLLFEYGIIHIYLEGLYNAFLILFRVTVLLSVTSILLTYTTTPLGLTDGLELLLSPLAKLHLPVHDFAMLMTIALRFIAPLVEETQKIMNAQAARGASFSEGNIFRRAKALIPILIPLFISAIRRAVELANAMECRCYIGGEGRTRMHILKSAPRDYLALCSIILLGVAVVFINKYAPGYSLSI